MSTHRRGVIGFVLMFGGMLLWVPALILVPMGPGPRHVGAWIFGSGMVGVLVGTCFVMWGLSGLQRELGDGMQARPRSCRTD